MGIYLSSPKTEKFSEDGENDRLRYGLSSMQGWRATMEDAVSNKGDLLSFRIIQIYVFFILKIIFYVVLLHLGSANSYWFLFFWVLCSMLHILIWMILLHSLVFMMVMEVRIGTFRAFYQCRSWMVIFTCVCVELCLLIIIIYRLLYIAFHFFFLLVFAHFHNESLTYFRFCIL